MTKDNVHIGYVIVAENRLLLLVTFRYLGYYLPQVDVLIFIATQRV
jgi:hypothetical protein